MCTFCSKYPRTKLCLYTVIRPTISVTFLNFKIKMKVTGVWWFFAKKQTKTMHLFHWCNMDWQSKVHRRVYLICVLDTCCTATKHPSETPVGGTYHQLMNSMTLQTLYSTIIPFHPSPLYRQCSYGSVLDNCALSSLHRITAWDFTTVWKILRYNTKSTCTHRISLL